MTEIAQILSQIEQGKTAAEELLPLVYEELRSLAALKVSGEASDSILPTVLVHEAYLRLVDVDQRHQWNSRGHFYAAAAEAMRRILIEHARRKNSKKRGGDFNRIELNEVQLVDEDRTVDLIVLDEALTRLEQRWPEKARLVKLRYFAGLTVAEAAKVMDVSLASAERYWKFARAWLYSQLRDDRA